MDGVIIPIHEKRDRDDVNKYRGAQFGFRKGRSTTDAIFILTGLVQNYLKDNRRLYVTYVDSMKCFDTTNRNALWLKLYKTGIQGKILNILRDMY